MELIHIYSGDTMFGERSGLFICRGWKGWWHIDSIHLILKKVGKRERVIDLDFGDRQVKSLPVWWVRFYYINFDYRNWLFGKVGVCAGVGGRSINGDFKGL